MGSRAASHGRGLLYTPLGHACACSSPGRSSPDCHGFSHWWLGARLAEYFPFVCVNRCDAIHRSASFLLSWELHLIEQAAWGPRQEWRCLLGLDMEFMALCKPEESTTFSSSMPPLFAARKRSRVEFPGAIVIGFLGCQIIGSQRLVRELRTVFVYRVGRVSCTPPANRGDPGGAEAGGCIGNNSGDEPDLVELFRSGCINLFFLFLSIFLFSFLIPSEPRDVFYFVVCSILAFSSFRPSSFSFSLSFSFVRFLSLFSSFLRFLVCIQSGAEYQVRSVQKPVRIITTQGVSR